MKCIASCLLALLLAPASHGGAGTAANSLQPFVDGHVLAGAVTLVATRDRILDVEAVGFADLATRRPMRTDTLFWIASMSKPIAAAAVMMLVDEGRISVDDEASKYLPGFLGQKVVTEQDADRVVLRRLSRPITIRNLLTHTSGLTPRTPLENHVDMLSLRENVMSYPMLPLRFEPGSRYEYSNAGINTAGRIVEIVTGLSYAEFLQKRLFDPLGMKDTTFWPNSEQSARLATSYQPEAGGAGLKAIPIDQLSYPLSDARRGVCPAGGLFSTAKDLSLFCRMILNGGAYGGRRYLSTRSVEAMTATQTGDLPVKGGVSLGYGFGWMTLRKPQGASAAGAFEHDGAYKTVMRLDPSRNLVSILLVSNARFVDGNQERMRTAFFSAAASLADRASH